MLSPTTFTWLSGHPEHQLVPWRGRGRGDEDKEAPSLPEKLDTRANVLRLQDILTFGLLLVPSSCAWIHGNFSRVWNCVKHNKNGRNAWINSSCPELRRLNALHHALQNTANQNKGKLLYSFIGVPPHLILQWVCTSLIALAYFSLAWYKIVKGEYVYQENTNDKRDVPCIHN